MKKKPEQFEFNGGEIGRVLSHYTLPELRIMRDAMEAELAKAEPQLKRLLDQIISCVPRQEAAAYTAALAVCPARWRGRLRSLRAIAAYTHGMELKACPLAHAPSLPPETKTAEQPEFALHLATVS